MMCAVLRCLLLLGVAIAVNALVIIDDVTVDKHWDAYKKEFGKVYQSKNEELHRRNVFEKALERIFVHQLAYDRGDETYTKGVNQFSDLTFEELFVGDRRITCKVKRRIGKKENATENIETLVRELGEPPEAINWITKGKVSPILRDQKIGACGGCYAFAAVSGVESANAIKHGLSGDNVLQLSEQQAIDCSRDFDCSGCAGGHPAGVYEMIIAKKGLLIADKYPWEKDQTKKHSCKSATVGEKAQLSAFKEFDRIPAKDLDTTIVKHVGLIGPITASACVSQSFVDYKNGVFADGDCFKNCLDNDDGINHTINIVGYTKDYFIVRNSWGKWGLDGYMKLKRVKDNALCNMGSDQTYPIAK